MQKIWKRSEILEENVTIDKQTLIQIVKMQKDEITSAYLYDRLAKREKNEDRKLLLEQISKDEFRHYEFFKTFSEKTINPSKAKITFWMILSYIFGMTFVAKLMEKGEEDAQEVYEQMEGTVNGIKEVLADEERHEADLINSFHEERLKYVGSIVLGLNDALVELTGALAGLTFALQDPNTVALAGLITGVAAAFSMASSEYLSTKQDESHKEALVSAIYTGTAYLIAVILMIIPFLVGLNVYVALGLTISIVIVIIFVFNFYISVAKDLNFKRRFLEMVTISLGVAFVSFIFSFVIKFFLGV